MISEITRTVYSGGGRSWLTLNAACNAEARKKIRTRCFCESGDDITPPIECTYHRDYIRYQKIRRRLAGIYKNQFRKKKGGAA